MKPTQRKVERVIRPEPVVEGAGVHLQRSLGTRSFNYFDPFLLLDHFDSKNHKDYEAGFPLHPHRGIETVTYMLSGEVRHKDTLGNSGSIRAGEVQWMTAGGGIMHEEMPQVHPEGVSGFQLWVNMPAQLKMTKPRYQGIGAEEIRKIKREDGTLIRLIAGEVDGVRGPVSGIAADPIYMDVSVPAGSSFIQPTRWGHHVFAYVFEGEGKFDGEGDTITHPKFVVFGDGDSVQVTAEKHPVRFLLVSGRPLHEPIARYGPFVMNTEEEIEEALYDLRMGTFVKE